jgi:hypothetical protein
VCVCACVRVCIYVYIYIELTILACYGVVFIIGENIANIRTCHREDRWKSENHVFSPPYNLLVVLFQLVSINEYRSLSVTYGHAVGVKVMDSLMTLIH